VTSAALLLRAYARADRWQLLLWVGGIGLLMLATTVAIGREFGDEDDRAGLVAIAAVNPAFLFLRGTPDGTGVGAVAFFQAFSFVAVLAGVMSTFLVVRHTRADEELGREELVAASASSRLAPLSAALLLGLGANLVLGAAVTLALAAGGLEARGATLTGAACAAVGITFAGVAAVVAQLMPTSRSANGLSAAIVGGAYLVRGVGDALGTPNATLTQTTSAWPSWLSPIGWAQQVGPFGRADAAPLLLNLTLAACLAALAIGLSARRDLGTSMFRERIGATHAGVFSRSLVGSAFRMQLPILLGWVVAAAVLGALAGVLAPTVADALASNAAVSDLVARLVSGTAHADAVDLFTTAILGMAGFLAAAAGVQAVLRLRSDESEGRAELLLAAPVKRGRWLATAVAVAAVSTMAVTVAAGFSAGLAFVGTGSPERFGSSAAAALVHAPAALVFVGTTAVVFAILPRRSVALGWGLLVTGLVLGQFGELLGLPEWMQSVSPFHHTPGLPLETWRWDPVLIMTTVAALLAASATGLVRRRDLPQ